MKNLATKIFEFNSRSQFCIALCTTVNGLVISVKAKAFKAKTGQSKDEGQRLTYLELRKNKQMLGTLILVTIQCVTEVA